MNEIKVGDIIVHGNPRPDKVLRGEVISIHMINGIVLYDIKDLETGRMNALSHPWVLAFNKEEEDEVFDFKKFIRIPSHAVEIAEQIMTDGLDNCWSVRSHGLTREQMMRDGLGVHDSWFVKRSKLTPLQEYDFVNVVVDRLRNL